MKCTLVFLAVLALITIVTAWPAKKDDLAKKGPGSSPLNKCLTDCNLDYKPICASEGKDKPKSFGSLCVLDIYNCEHSSNLKVKSEGECPGGGGVRLS